VSPLAGEQGASSELDEPSRSSSKSDRGPPGPTSAPKGSLRLRPYFREHRSRAVRGLEGPSDGRHVELPFHARIVSGKRYVPVIDGLNRRRSGDVSERVAARNPGRRRYNQEHADARVEAANGSALPVSRRRRPSPRVRKPPTRLTHDRTTCRPCTRRFGSSTTRPSLAVHFGGRCALVSARCARTRTVAP